MTSGQGEQCVGGTGDSVGGAGTGVIQEGKRVRKPSQKARALQETSKAKVRPASSSSLCLLFVSSSHSDSSCGFLFSVFRLKPRRRELLFLGRRALVPLGPKRKSSSNRRLRSRGCVYFPVSRCGS